MVRRFLGKFASWSPVDLTLFALAVLLVASATVRVALAARAHTQPGDSSASEVPSLPPSRDVLPETPAEAVVAAVATDPFRPDRSAPPLRYRPGSDAPESSRRRVDRRARIPDLRLRGTAVHEGGGLAVIDGIPGIRGARVYGPGDTIGDFRLELVDGDSVVFVGPDTTIVFRILRPWQSGPR
jgi:hypothetical protein